MDKAFRIRDASGGTVELVLLDNGDQTYSIGAAPAPVDEAVVTAINSLATSQPALAANPDRRGVTAVNTDANACLLKYGATASATSLTVRIPANGYWEMPLPIYRGRIDVIWEANGSGALVMTEL